MEVKTLKDFGLKGKVKSVKKYEEVLEGTGNSCRISGIEIREFDENGNLVMESGRGSTEKYECDFKKRIIKIKRFGSNGHFREYELLKYNEAGKLIEDHKYENNDGHLKMVRKKEYDENGRIIAEYDAWHNNGELKLSEKYDYVKYGRKIGVYRNGELYYVETYDENGRLIKKEDLHLSRIEKYDKNEKKLLEREQGFRFKKYKYDDDGNLIKISERERDCGKYPQSITTEYKYDDKGNKIYEKETNEDWYLTFEVRQNLYFYDGSGKKIFDEKYRKGRSTSYEIYILTYYKYDEIGNVVEEEIYDLYLDGEGKVEKEIYKYEYEYEYYE